MAKGRVCHQSITYPAASRANRIGRFQPIPVPFLCCANICASVDETAYRCLDTRMERNSKRIVKRLLSEGWEHVLTNGSHAKFRKGGQTVIVPHPKNGPPSGTARGIAKMAGWL